MVDFPQYPVFVADQVLTADHLNEIVNYLDEQQRLTRNKLIGIGIVCGLEIRVGASQVEITKGCGITSQGYLIVQDQQVLTYRHEYILPEDFYAAYKPVYENWHMWELVTAERSLGIDDAVALNSAFLQNKVVVLLLEMKEIPLKNCIETDCDDKGNKIEFTVRPLLVERRDIDAFTGNPGENRPEAQLSRDEIQLKRFNVPVTSLSGSDDVLQAFLKLVDDNTLQRLSQALNACYTDYTYILTGETGNPFTNVLTIMRDKLNEVKSSNPYFIPYYYDWIDDLVKAYNEFKEQAWHIQMMCCPDENLFPLHLMLGEADRSTSFDYTSNYRHYFINSPLFNAHKDALTEVQFLFRRLKLMIENNQIKNPVEFSRTAIKITPSHYLDKTLSQRCIPYYYNPVGLYQCWNWNKTRSGNARYNLSYHSNLYNTSDVVINPLNYDIEKFTFFRIEGHAGKNHVTALRNIIAKRDSHNLPFDVVAVSTSLLALPDVNSGNCAFQDLQALYEVLVAELMCKIGGPVKFIGNLDVEKNADKPDGTVIFKPFTMIAAPVKAVRKTKAKSVADKAAGPVKDTATTVNAGAAINYVISNEARRAPYVKGDILAESAAVENKVSSIYVSNWIKNNTLEAIKLIGQQSSYLLIFINTAEDLFQALPPLLSDFNLELFLKYYKLLVSQLPDVKESLLKSYRDAVADKTESKFTEDYALYFSQFQNMESLCFDKQFTALSKEYQERVARLKLAKSFQAFFASHHGLEHKAGVPKGGTFVLVYHEETNSNDDTNNFNNLTIGANLSGADSVKNITKKSAAPAKSAQATSAKNAPLTSISGAEVKSNEVFLKMLKDDFKLSDDKINDIIKVVGTVNEISPAAFDLENGSVIADFYVPYLCCSDCPSVTYVFPEEPKENVVFDIQPRTYLFDDAHNYPFTATPPVTDANKEQNPFSSPDLANPGKLNLWADAANVLYLHPAMETEKTFRTNVTYKDITIDLTIIRPDATFTVTVTRSNTNNSLQLQVEAVNKDATDYKWLVNEKENVLPENSFRPRVMPITLSDSNPQFIIELIITYKILDAVSDDSEKRILSLADIRNHADGVPF